MKISIMIVLAFVPTLAYADDDNGFSTAATLGWLAIGCGMAANLSLIIFKMIKKMPIMKLVGGSSTSQSLTSMYQPVLNFHILLNSVGFFAGLSHGFMLIRGLDYISLSLVIVMTVSMISGIILKFASDKNLKFFSRLVHGQAILAALLVTLVVLHVITRWHHGIIMHFI
ncbi:MAG: hypothetical protein KGH89_08350 [Thaumarchaeota archaeon]|nr:hypothetical protein [Nitrososphaerota archaeon]MDE1867445.1 hypothetical protein [Nitrososphaerota archaeon]